ncbi:hypothetical protein SASPL_100989 [Salvia splendens]|uniref:Fatty acyl-CoA reductase n=1 Tax=Salvia splendens TaxID=180675 RepID=A0A8X9ABH6_SALSN|nr:hypothetical protein SASPL_100989 [Salvia splendens]
MEESKIIQHFEGKTILITGSTGFLAKIFLEKILRLQPNVVGTELFGVLRKELGGDFESMISSKVVAISGDVGYENLGIIDVQLRHQMWREIDVIVNSAATTKFDERYDIAYGINSLGAMHVQDFGTKCSKLEMLLHVSTAYVHGTKVGLMPEKPFRMGETLPGAKIPYLDIEAEKSVIQERLRFLQMQKLSEKEITRAMKDFGIERAMLHGWPNTYVFTKAMGEMLLERSNQNCNVVIIRPTIITSTFKDPFHGWIEGLRTLDSIFVAYGKGKIKFFVGDPESVVDLVPGDMVMLGLANMICCNLFESSYTNAKRRINHAMRLADLYKPYLFSQAIFDDSNTETLRMRMRGSKIDTELFNFDPKCIMWDDYILNTHFLGIAKYVLNC